MYSMLNEIRLSLIEEHRLPVKNDYQNRTYNISQLKTIEIKHNSEAHYHSNSRSRSSFHNHILQTEKSNNLFV